MREFPLFCTPKVLKVRSQFYPESAGVKVFGADYLLKKESNRIPNCEQLFKLNLIKLRLNDGNAPASHTFPNTGSACF